MLRAASTGLLMLHNIDLHGIFECEIYGKWSVQASIDIHTRLRNAVMLVWGMLGLTPISPQGHFVPQLHHKTARDMSSLTCSCRYNYSAYTCRMTVEMLTE